MTFCPYKDRIDRHIASEARIARIQKRIDRVRIAEAARCFATAIETRDAWWIGAAQSAVDHVYDNAIRLRTRELADALFEAMFRKSVP